MDTSSGFSSDSQLQMAADDWLRDVIRRCGKAYRSLSLYDCKGALRDVDLLPPELQSSPWALEIVAKSFYEMANYVLARRAFEALVELEPYRLQSMEAYSIVASR